MTVWDKADMDIRDAETWTRQRARANARRERKLAIRSMAKGKPHQRSMRVNRLKHLIATAI